MYLGQAMSLFARFVFFALLTGVPLAPVFAPKGDDPCPDVPGVVSPLIAPDLLLLEQQAQNGSASAAIILSDTYTAQAQYAKAEKWARYSLYKGDGRGAIKLYDLSKAGHITLGDAEKIRQYGFGLIEQDARKGNGGSAVTLGTMYLFGQGVDTDYDKAHDWFVIAEEAGKPMASYQLGVLYSNGLYQPISNRKAFRYFKKAAVGGIAAATRQVAIAYHTGLGAEQNLDQALVCYERSARQGDPLAMRDLGNFYMYERPDRGQSESWHKKAAALGNPDSAYELGIMYKGSSESKKYFDAATKYKHHMARVQVDPDYVPKDELVKDETPKDE